MKPLKFMEGKRTAWVIISWLESYENSCGFWKAEITSESAMLGWVQTSTLFLSLQVENSRL